MPNRLTNLEVQAVALVDDPAVPKARYLIAKRNDASTPDNSMTDTTRDETDENLSVLERIGKGVMDLLGASPADTTTRTRIAQHIAKAAEADDATADETDTDEVEKADAEAADEAEETEKSADDEPAAEAAEDEAEETEKSADEESAADEAEESEETEKSADDDEADEAADETDPNAELLAAFKSMLDTELAPIREAVGKTADAASDLDERLETMEKRKGVSKQAKGSDIESDDSDEAMFGNVIFGS